LALTGFKYFTQSIVQRELIQKIGDVDQLVTGDGVNFRNAFVRYLRSVRDFPKDARYKVVAGEEEPRDLDIDPVMTTSIDSFYRRPFNLMLRRRSLVKMRRFIRACQRFARDYRDQGDTDDERDGNTRRVRFLGMVIVVYIIVMKNLFFIPVLAYQGGALSEEKVAQGAGLADIGIDRRMLARVFPLVRIVRLLQKEGPEHVLQLDITDEDLTYVSVMLRRIMTSEVV